jgi:hypothetical protein
MELAQERCLFMATTSKKIEPIFIGIGEERIELQGAELEAFLEQRAKDQEQTALLEAEYKAKRDARESAITKLGEIAGLTKEELDAIL